MKNKFVGVVAITVHDMNMRFGNHHLEENEYILTYEGSTRKAVMDYLIDKLDYLQPVPYAGQEEDMKQLTDKVEDAIHRVRKALEGVNRDRPDPKRDRNATQFFDSVMDLEAITDGEPEAIFTIMATVCLSIPRI